MSEWAIVNATSLNPRRLNSRKPAAWLCRKQREPSGENFRMALSLKRLKFSLLPRCLRQNHIAAKGFLKFKRRGFKNPNDLDLKKPLPLLCLRRKWQGRRSESPAGFVGRHEDRGIPATYGEGVRPGFLKSKSLGFVLEVNLMHTPSGQRSNESYN